MSSSEPRSERALRLQVLLAEDGIEATYEECVQLLVADLVEQIRARNVSQELDTVSV